MKRIVHFAGLGSMGFGMAHSVRTFDVDWG